MVYLAIFNLIVPHMMKPSGTFLIFDDPSPPNFELFPTETLDYFGTIGTGFKVLPLFNLESFPYTPLPFIIMT